MSSPPVDDPAPLPPPPPAADECCGEGCAHCVWDLHDAALARYRHALAQWRLRHPDATGGDAAP